MRTAPILLVCLLILAGPVGGAHASTPLPPTLVYHHELPTGDEWISPAAAGDGVTFTVTIDDPGGQYAAYYDDIERLVLAAGEEWARYFDADAVIELRISFDDGDGACLMVAGPVLVHIGETFNGFDVWQAGTIWEIRGNADPNGVQPDGEIIIAPAFLDSFFWEYPQPPTAHAYDAYDTFLHELGHIFGFLHLEEYYTGVGPWASTYDIQTTPLVTGHAFAGPLTVDVYDGPVPLADTLFPEDRSHVAISTGPGSLMYPYADWGVRHSITKVELAIVADSGMPVQIPCLEDSSDLTVDTDLDGVADCVDNCSSTANEDQLDTDADGAGDLCDACPLDANKSLDEGVCGCGVPDTDGDGDGAPDCSDGCPNDPLKVDAGICGCDVADVDTDGDGAFDCADGCPSDPAKTDAGVCGCGVADTDSDNDGVADCEQETEEDDTADGLLTLDDDEELSQGEDQPAEGGSDGGSVACGAGVIGFLPVMLTALLLVGRSNRRGNACG